MQYESPERVYDAAKPPEPAVGLPARDARPADARKTVELAVFKDKDLDTFYRNNSSSMLVWPLANFLILCSLWRIPKIAAFFEARGMQPWGFENAVHYCAFAVLLSFAFHGFVCTYGDFLKPTKVQSSKPYNTGPAAMATRQTAVLLTELIFSALPVRPVSTSWAHFVATLFAFAVAWDAWFFVVHYVCHRSTWAYGAIHKTHHSCKEPNCFGAFFVNYNSHVLTHQIVVLTGCVLFVPQDVLKLTLYLGLLGTFLEHAGYEMGHLKLPLIPLTVGHVLSATSAVSLFLGSMETTHHDWHHEKFVGNYALSFTYLDRIFGTLHQGRVAEKKLC